MKADLTRRTFNPLKHFTRVLMQQGRVQLDADWNEQAAVLLHYQRALAADLIGSHGGPDGNFAISPLAIGSSAPAVLNDFLIGAGHYYVDGILCEADSKLILITAFPVTGDNNKVKILYWPQDDLAFSQDQYVEISDGAVGTLVPTLQARINGLDPASRTLTLDTSIIAFKGENVKPRVRHLITYMTQPDYPVPVKEQLNSPVKNAPYLVYLDVWERLITYVEDDSIREVALDGPDTAARSKVVWQVKIADLKRPTACLTVEQLNEQFQWENRGWLKARANQESNSTDPCIISPDARYRGTENQLYRVEIHGPGNGWNGKAESKTSAATFKWSRENGSVVYPTVALISEGGTTTVTLENLGRDDRFGLAQHDWVEIVDDDLVLQNGSENLLKVQSVHPDNMTVTLSGSHTSDVGKFPAKHPLLRRWDHQAGDQDEGGLQLGSDGAALIIEGANWLELEDGVQIQFQPADKVPQNIYRTGDYWLIPARTATGDVEWPREKDNQGNVVYIAKSPDGISHHYAPLAVIKVNPDGVALVDPPCRETFPPMAKPILAP